MRFLAILTFILFSVLFSSSCSSSKKMEKKGFAFQNQTFSEEDSTYSDVYITGTKPIDSVDVNKMIYDIFRVEYKNYPEEIKLYGRPYDSLGNFVTQMADPYKLDPKKKYFTSIEEKLGKLYKVRNQGVPEFTVREFGAGDSIAYNLVLSLDYSGSIKQMLDVIMEGTELFVGMKFPYDKIGISSFNNEFDIKVPIIQDKNKIINLYKAKMNDGVGLFSAVYDGLWNSISMLEETEEDSPRVIVIFTDGDDNYSRVKIGQLIKRAKEENIIIFTIAFGYSIDDNLKYIAQYTGGRFYKVYTKEELLKVFRDIYMSLRYYYLITYKPPLYWGYHTAFSELSLPNRAEPMVAEAEYNTSDLSEISDTSEVFKRPILFPFNSDTIKVESFQILDEITDAMMVFPRLRLEVQGHTDNVGLIDYNQDLSERRAEAVMNALIDRGINPRRLRSRGFGMSMPITSNDTPEGQAQNRRTQFVVTAK